MTATLADMVETTLRFYEVVPASGLEAVDQADMLLFEFGVYNWGQGTHFQFGICRQFIVDGAEDDDAISQLHCTFLYKPTPDLRAIGSGLRWCESRVELQEFRAFILSSVAYAKASPLPVKRRQFDWWQI